jgi:hypothetical protein
VAGKRSKKYGPRGVTPLLKSWERESARDLADLVPVSQPEASLRILKETERIVRMRPTKLPKV